MVRGAGDAMGTLEGLPCRGLKRSLPKRGDLHRGDIVSFRCAPMSHKDREHRFERGRRVPRAGAAPRGKKSGYVLE